MVAVVVSFVAVLAIFIAVGLGGAMRRRRTADDFLTAGREVHPWLVGFAAAATNSSGYMFIGLIGATVRDGLSSMWLMVGWIVGDWLAWLVIHRRLRDRAAAVGAKTVSEYIGAGDAIGAGGQRVSVSRVLCGLLTLSILATYAAAQFVAGAKGVTAILGWPTWIGVLIGFTLLLAYCFTGGLRSSIWVNAAQSFVMISSVGLLLGAALWELGGPTSLWERLRELDPKYVDWRPANLQLGFAAFMISWIAAGVGVVGQPHLMTIAMTIDSGENMRRARRVYFVWYWLFSACCILVGLCCRALLNDRYLGTGGGDPEMALPTLAVALLPGVLVGMILGGLFSATLSTADTQILCASGALSHDLIPALGKSYGGARAGMLVVAIAVAVIALFGPQSVFDLVVLSWAWLACSLGPALVMRTLGARLSDAVGVAMILTGLAVSLLWRFAWGLSPSMYEVLPGMLAGFAMYGAAWLLRLLPATETLPAREALPGAEALPDVRTAALPELMPGLKAVAP